MILVVLYYYSDVVLACAIAAHVSYATIKLLAAYI